MPIHHPLILSEAEEKLKELNVRCEQLVDLQVQERNRLKRTSIRGGRKCLRTAVYMATLSAIKHNVFIKTFYDGLVARGKVKKVALIASMRKLLILCHRLVQDGREFTVPSPTLPQEITSH